MPVTFPYPGWLRLARVASTFHHFPADNPDRPAACGFRVRASEYVTCRGGPGVDVCEACRAKAPALRSGDRGARVTLDLDDVLRLDRIFGRGRRRGIVGELVRREAHHSLLTRPRKAVARG